jgi:alkanesulfonate monooxygenase SsuD/methylene tetrahydromethanopterin reductase-like flavin-dependent oxidoreductase (luciferase family)
MDMRFGLFGSAQANGSDLAAGIGQGFHDYIDFNVEAEALGYHSTFLVEHHFTGWSQVSATLSLLTYLAARTKTMRLGTAVMVVPWHNPVLLAEQAATLDVLSGGRLDFGIGKGYRHSEFTGFCIPSEEAEARFEEGLEVILRAWTTEGRFSHHGKYWNFENIVVEPAAAQRPRPAIWMAAGSEPSIDKVARRGFNLLLDQFAGPDLIKQRLDRFRSELKAVGRSYNPMDLCVARELYIAKDQKDKEDAIERLTAGRQRTIDVSKAPDQTGGSHILSYARSGAPDTSSALIGTTEEIYDKLVALNEAGADYVILSVLGGSRPTLRQFAKEIIPEFNSYRAVGHERRSLA